MLNSSQTDCNLRIVKTHFIYNEEKLGKYVISEKQIVRILSQRLKEYKEYVMYPI